MPSTKGSRRVTLDKETVAGSSAALNKQELEILNTLAQYEQTEHEHKFKQFMDNQNLIFQDQVQPALNTVDYMGHKFMVPEQVQGSATARQKFDA